MAVDAAAAKIMKNERGADVSTTVSIQVVCSVVDVSIYVIGLESVTLLHADFRQTVTLYGCRSHTCHHTRNDGK